ncbi:MAG TPA: glycine cleavage system protein GcvH [Kiloniellales bacterium]
MGERKYTKDHEWVLVEGDVATVGISEHAQEQLGDIVFVELPEAGAAIKQGAQAATVESVKAASEIYAPISGTVTQVNGALADEPALINSDALGKGWLFKAKIKNLGELGKLMDEGAYKKFLESLD